MGFGKTIGVDVCYSRPEPPASASRVDWPARGEARRVIGSPAASAFPAQTPLRLPISHSRLYPPRLNHLPLIQDLSHNALFARTAKPLSTRSYSHSCSRYSSIHRELIELLDLAASLPNTSPIPSRTSFCSHALSQALYSLLHTCLSLLLSLYSSKARTSFKMNAAIPLNQVGVFAPTTQNLNFAVTSNATNIAGTAMAIPVAIDKLGAHLQAAYESKPILDVIRMCHRFGNGPDVHINRVPPEVLAMIEGYVKVPLENYYEHKWSKDLKCIQGECKPSDHFSHDRIIDIQKGFEDRCACTCGCGQLVNVQPVSTYMSGSEERRCLHQAAISRWMTRIDSMPANTQGSHVKPEGQFAKLERLMRSKFGLDIFINDYDMSDPMHGTCKKSTLIAHIIHPVYQHFMSTRLNHLGVVANIAYSFPIPRRLLKPLPVKEEKRFKLAMKELNLKPFVHPLQIRQKVDPMLKAAGPVDTANRRCQRAANLENDEEWPRLCNLARGQGFRYP